MYAAAAGVFQDAVLERGEPALAVIVGTPDSQVLLIPLKVIVTAPLPGTSVPGATLTRAATGGDPPPMPYSPMPYSPLP